MRINWGWFGGFVLLALSACGGGGSSSGSVGSGATQSYTVGGTVTGLSGSGLVLQNNAGNDLTITASGNFTFSTAVANGAGYAVTVKTQPKNPAQICSATNASGTVSNANVTSIAINCGPPLARVVFSDNNDLFAVNEDGSGMATLANALEVETVAQYRSTYDFAYFETSYNGASLYQPMVQNGRAVYSREIRPSSGRVQHDLYAVNLDGTGRVALAATAADESAITLVGGRVVYLSYDQDLSTGAETYALRSVLLDGSADTLIATGTSISSPTFLAIAGTKVIFSTSTGTFAVNADGSAQVTLWNQQAAVSIVAANRVVLCDSSGELVAVNLDGNGFVSLGTGAVVINLSYFGVGNIAFGVVSNRVFYSVVDSGTGLFSVRSIGLDGANPLLLGASTTYIYVTAISGSRLIATDLSQTVSYDITQANSRLPLLSSARPYCVAGNRVVGIDLSKLNANNTLSFLSINADATAAATLATGTASLNNNVNNAIALITPTQLLYRKSAVSGQLEGYAVDLDGNGTSQVTMGAGDKELMGIVNNRLVYQSYAIGNNFAPRNLYSVALDGSALVDLATTSADERYLAQFSDRVLYTSNNGSVVELKVVPVGGGTPALLYSSPNGKSFVGAF